MNPSQVGQSQTPTTNSNATPKLNQIQSLHDIYAMAAAQSMPAAVGPESTASHEQHRGRESRRDATAKSSRNAPSSTTTTTKTTTMTESQHKPPPQMRSMSHAASATAAAAAASSSNRQHVMRSLSRDFVAHVSTAKEVGYVKQQQQQQVAPTHTMLETTRLPNSGDLPALLTQLILSKKAAAPTTTMREQQAAASRESRSRLKTTTEQQQQQQQTPPTASIRSMSTASIMEHAAATTPSRTHSISLKPSNEQRSLSTQRLGGARDQQSEPPRSDLPLSLSLIQSQSQQQQQQSQPQPQRESRSRSNQPSGSALPAIRSVSIATINERQPLKEANVAPPPIRSSSISRANRQVTVDADGADSSSLESPHQTLVMPQNTSS